jgi:hypothetical protein
MALLSLTRLRLHSWRAYPGFILWVVGSLLQSLRSDGLLGLMLLRDRHNAFWTLTLWRDQQAMQVFRNQGSHGQAMRRLAQWCDESAAAHWQVNEAVLDQLRRPDWTVLQRRLMQEGHFAPLPLASPDQSERKIPAPALGRGRLISLR